MPSKRSSRTTSRGTSAGAKKLYAFIRIAFAIMLAIGGIIYGISNRSANTASTVPTVSADGKLVVYFIDVGQGDSELIETSAGHFMLIDAGPTDSADDLVDFLSARGVETLEWVVFTHAHEDHIGGAVKVLQAFGVNNILMTDVSYDSKLYTNMMAEINAGTAAVHYAVSGDTYTFDDTLFRVLAPNSTGYSNFNDNSVVIRMTYGNTSAMFTGDASDVSEKEILDKYSSAELKCSLLKVGHHGSSTSSSADFLAAVSPVYAVISCGTGNDYGHPHQETLDRLADIGVTVYRTDQDGTVVFASDGNSFSLVSEGTVSGTETDAAA